MKEKENGQISLTTALLIIAILIMGIMCIVIYKLNNEKNIETQKIDDLQSQVNTLKDLSVNVQEKSDDTIKKESDETVINYTNEDKYTEITNTLGKDDIFWISKAEKNNDGTYTLKGVIYTKATLTKAELENSVSNGKYQYCSTYYTVKKNYQDSTSNIKYDYAFIGKFNNEDRVEFYAEKKDENTYYINSLTENPTEWKLTNEYKKITVSGNVQVIDEYDQILKVKDYFEGYKEKEAVETSRPDNCFNIKFENNECSEIIKQITGY